MEKRRVGRPSMGLTRQVKLTLPEEDWKIIEELIEKKEADGFSDYFRQLHQSSIRERRVADKWKSL